MNDLTPETGTSGTVARKTVHGALFLGIRQILVQGARILGGIFLARLLSPSQFGIYAIVLYLQSFLTAFGDAGLGASLIRQHEEPEPADYRAVFTAQQLLVLAICLVLWLLAPLLATGYHLHRHEAWLFRLVALSFLITSFAVIPLIRLERHLAFDRVAIIESVRAIAFNAFAVYLAWRGLGSYAFVYALILSATMGTLLANWISRWRIGWRWDWPRIRSHLAFGLPYQGVQVASLLKDSIAPIFIGIFLRTADVGYVTWAMMIAAYPVLILMVLQRLYMPAFARLQHQRPQLVKLTENVIWGTNAITAPLATLTLAMITPITIIVYGAKWLTALHYFYFFWLANLLVPTATPAMGLLNALGKSKTTFMFSILWMAGTWIIGAPLILLYGAIGFAIANFVVTLSSIWLYRVAQQHVPFRIYSVVAPAWTVASGIGIALYALCRFHPPSNILSLGIYVASGLITYAAGIYLFNKHKVRAAWSALARAQ